MATTKILTFLIAFLVSSTIILAQESSQSPNSGSGNNGVESTPATSSASSIFSFNPIHFDFNAFWPDFFGSAAAAFGFGSRHKRSAVEIVEAQEHSRHKRSVIKCNYATEGGFRCTGCRQARRCYPFGLATLTTCRGFSAYCHNGVCSTTKGPLCSATTSTTSTSSSTTESSTSSSSTISSSLTT